MCQISSLFQIIYYTLHNGNKITTLHVLNACEIYEKCKMSDANERKVPFPSYFETSSFTLLPFDNFDHTDITTLSSQDSSCETAITLFQEKPSIRISKSSKSEVDIPSVEHIDKLPCQDLIHYNSTKGTTKVDEEHYKCPGKVQERDSSEFILSFIHSLSPQNKQQGSIQDDTIEIEEGVFTSN